MNGVKKIKLLLIIILLFPMSVKAYSGTASITCTTGEFKAGDTLECAVGGMIDDSVGTVDMKVSINGPLEITSFQKSDGEWQGTYEDNSIALYRADDFTGIFNIGTFNLKVSDNATAGNATITLSDIEFSTVGKETTVDSQSVTINIVDTPVTVIKGLKSLDVNNGTMNHQFNSSESSYLVMLSSADTTNFSIIAVPNNENDTVSAINVDSSEVLSLDNIYFVAATNGGNSTMNVRINVGSGDTLVSYNLIVAKPASSTVSDPTLASLIIANKDINLLNNGNNDEEVNVVLDDISNYSLIAKLSDNINYKYNTTNLPTTCSVVNDVLTCNFKNESSFILIVESSNDNLELSAKKYIININKSASGNNNNVSNNNENNTVNNNPKTGTLSIVIITILLIISLFASLYLYKRNIKSHDKTNL